MKEFSVFIVIIVSFIAIQHAWATPIQINYQGRMLDDTNLVQGSHTIRFDFFASGISTSVLYRESDSVTVVDGLYSTTIGDNPVPMGTITAGPPPQPQYANLFGLLDNASNLYIELAIDGTVMTPREQLHASGYAIVANQALGVRNGSITREDFAAGLRSTLDGAGNSVTNAVIVNTNGYVGVGESNIWATLHVSGGPSVITPVRYCTLYDSGTTFTNLQNAVSVVAQGNYAYVGALYDKTVTILCITNPSNPRLVAELVDGVGDYDYLSGLSRVQLSGNYLYIAAAYDNAVTIVNVSDPENPVYVTSLVDGSGGYSYLAGAREMTIVDDYLFIAASTDDALTIVDVSNPNTPSLQSQVYDGLGSFQHLESLYDVAVEGDYAYVPSSTEDAVTIMSITNKAMPTFVAVITNGAHGFERLQSPRYLAVKDGYLYVGVTTDDALILYDVSTPESPQLVKLIENGECGFESLYNITRVRRYGSYLCTAQGHPGACDIADISEPENPRVVASFRDDLYLYHGLGGLSDVFMLDDLVFMTAESDHTLTISSISITNSAGQAGFVTDDRVGIGTVAPREELDVNGNAIISDDLIVEDDIYAMGDLYLMPYTNLSQGAVRINNDGSLYVSEEDQQDYAIPACAFRPETSDISTNVFFGSTTAYIVGGSDSIYAPLCLPDDGYIYAIYVRFLDNDSANNLRFRIIRQDERSTTTEVIGSFTSGGSSASVAQTNLMSDVLSSTDIDNYNYTYYIRVNPYIGSRWTEDLQVYNVTVRCRFPD